MICCNTLRSEKDPTDLAVMFNNMDEEKNFANAQQTPGAQVKWKRAQPSAENTSQNEDTCQAVELSGIGQSNTVKKSSCRAAAAFLGLLSLLLLTGLIWLFLYTKDYSEWEMKTLQLQTSYNNLTEENLQLQTSYNNLTEENLQLQTSYNNLTEKFKKLEDVATDLRRKLQVLHAHEWNYFNGNYYYISSTKKSWQESRNDCLQKGADLVIINSPEEQEFVGKRKKRVWIGLTETETKGTWKWVDGTLPVTRYWAKSEPNNSNGNEDCAESEKSWNDLSCDNKRPWICEAYFKI